MNLLQRLIHDAHRTMLIATHDRDILELADRVLVLRDGTLEAHTPDEVLTS